MDKHFFFRSGKHRTDGVQSISLRDNKFSTFYKFTHLQTVTAVSLKIKSKWSRSCSSPFSRVSERSHKHVSLRSFLLKVKCFSKFKLIGILERSNVFFIFFHVSGLYCEFGIFWIHLYSVSDSIYLQELFIAVITFPHSSHTNIHGSVTNLHFLLPCSPSC